MPENPPFPEFWVDELIEKHECGGYRDPIQIELKFAGRVLQLVAPDWLEGRTEVLETTISASGDLLYLVVKESSEDAYMGFNPILIVARRRESDQYEVVVWHHLYPWAIERLSLDARPPSVLRAGDPQ